MKKTETEESLKNALKEIEININSAWFHILGIEREISILDSMQVEIEENILVLSRRKVLNIKDDHKINRIKLKKIQKRKEALKQDLSAARRIYMNMERLYSETKAKYDILLKNNESNNNVLKVDFGGQKRTKT